MKSEHIKKSIKEYESYGNKVYGFYVTYKETENITCQRWGKMEEFDKILSEIESSQMCIQGELPVEKFIIYSGEQYRWQCLVFIKNPLWDCVNMDSEDSHTNVVVPYIAEDGWFGKIITERENIK
jgi:hypothetical protein